MISKHISFLFFCFFSLLISAQSKNDPHKSKEFQRVKKIFEVSNHNLDQLSHQLLDNAQTDYEKTFANLGIGGVNYRNGRYLEAVYYYEQAELFGKRTDSITLKITYTNGLVNSYRRAGLIEQSNDSWKKESELFKKSKNPYKEAEYYYNLSKIYDIDEDYCNSAKSKEKYLSLVPLEVQKLDPDYIFAVYAQLGFVQFKCGKTEAAILSLQNADKTIQKNQDKTTSSLYEIYELTKALISNKKGDKELAKSYFDLAYNRAKTKFTVATVEMILLERLKADIDPPTEQLVMARELDDIHKLGTKTSRELTQYEFIKAKERVSVQKRKTLIIIIIGCICIIVLICVILFIRKRNKKLKVAYDKILSDLDSKSFLSKQKQNVAETNFENKEIENECDVIKKLERLESKAFFTGQNISAIQLAVMLKISPRNLSYILKKYRGDDFYNYLNNVRIEYIIKSLRENPKLLNYKIAALAEMCGYNSHSQFTINFKLKTGISPSQYIQFLQKEIKK